MNNRVAIYLRLSDEDFNKNLKTDISESIKNQERMLIDYAKSNNFKIIGVFNDEDYSGIDKNRPEFNKMIKECELGNVDIVLCKTQSRFTRDIELVEKYLHNKFIEWNVRFIGLVDNADTNNKGNKKQRQINGLVNEWYLEDTSQNIRETLKNKRENGLCTSAFTPYGYLKDVNNKNHLIVDEMVRENIIKIFDMYSNGASLEKITKTLNNSNVPSPIEYKKMNGSKLFIPILKDYYNYSFIEKSGTYKIVNTFFNNENKVLKNIITTEILSNDENKFTDNFDIKLIYKSSNNLNIYYSTIPSDKLNLRNLDINKDFIKLQINDCLPNNTTIIATHIEKLDRSNEIKYEFEVFLKENKNHLKYKYIINATSENGNNLKFNTVIRKKFKWCAGTIKKILKDEVYIGNLVQYKTTTVSYKNKTVIKNDINKQIIVKNTHEKIIDKRLWNNVQKRLESNAKSTKKGSIHILANKLYCQNCNSIFYKCGSNNRFGSGYLACKDKFNKWVNCDNKKYIKESELHEIIKICLNNLFKSYYDETHLLEICNTIEYVNLYNEKTKYLEKEKDLICIELSKKISYKERLYEDYINNILDYDEYISLKTKYKNEIIQIKDKINKIEECLSNINIKNNMHDRILLFQKYKKIDILTNNIINDFVDKIYIGKYNFDTNTRKIKIVWNFDFDNGNTEK